MVSLFSDLVGFPSKSRETHLTILQLYLNLGTNISNDVISGRDAF